MSVTTDPSVLLKQVQALVQARENPELLKELLSCLQTQPGSVSARASGTQRRRRSEKGRNGSPTGFKDSAPSLEPTRKNSFAQPSSSDGSLGSSGGGAAEGNRRDPGA